MSQMVRTVRFNAEEERRLQERARETGLYPHGFVKVCIRFALGLPISTHDRREVIDVALTPES